MLFCFVATPGGAQGRLDSVLKTWGSLWGTGDGTELTTSRCPLSSPPCQEALASGQYFLFQSQLAQVQLLPSFPEMDIQASDSDAASAPARRLNAAIRYQDCNPFTVVFRPHQVVLGSNSIIPTGHLSGPRAAPCH